MTMERLCEGAAPGEASLRGEEVRKRVVVGLWNMPPAVKKGARLSCKIRLTDGFGPSTEKKASVYARNGGGSGVGGGVNSLPVIVSPSQA